MPEIIGWGSALILLPAFGLQTYRQWRLRHEPANPSAIWFFILVLIGTGGQVAYSWMLRNWVYLALNSALVVNNGVGLGIAVRRRKVPAHGPAAGRGTASKTHHSESSGQSTMPSDDQNQGEEERREPEPRDDERDQASALEQHRNVVTTTDPTIATGRASDEGRTLRPDETVVAETSRIHRAVPGYVTPDANAFVEPERPASRESGDQGKDKRDAKGQGQGDDKKGKDDKQQKGKAEGKGKDDEKKGKDKDQSEGHKQPAHAGKSGWMSYAATAVLALVCGLAGAWIMMHFGSSKGDDQSKKGGSSQSKNDSSKGQSKEGGEGGGGGSSGDSGSQPSGLASAEAPDTLRKQIEHLTARIGTLGQRIDAMSIPRDASPPNLNALQIKVGELSRAVDQVASLPARDREIENRLDQLREEMKEVRAQLAALKEHGTTTAEAPTPAPAPAARPLGDFLEHKLDEAAGPPSPSASSAPPTYPSSSNDAMKQAIALFKKGQYGKAEDVFRKLQLSRAQDARVWYYSALAHGFATNQWDGETRRFVVQGADCEREGKPPTPQVDAAFADLSPAQGKDWLTSYRSQLVKR